MQRADEAARGRDPLARDVAVLLPDHGGVAVVAGGDLRPGYVGPQRRQGQDRIR